MRRHLLEALLPEQTHQRLYHEHQGFHMAVDGLVNMLPGLVAGMASQALEDESRRLTMVQELKDHPADITWFVQSEQMEVESAEPPEPTPLPPAKRAPRSTTRRKTVPAPKPTKTTRKRTR